MKIGVINMPGRESYDGQNIRTRFFILGLPLFPTGCFYKISNNLGINVPLRGVDILHAYAKVHFALLGVGGLMWASNIRGSEAMTKSLLVVLSLFLLGFSLYSWIKHSAVQGDEEQHRRIFGKAFLYNMNPELLPTHVQKSLYGELHKTYFGRFGSLDWQEQISGGEINKGNFALLYTLAFYQKTIDPKPAHQALFTTIAAKLNQGQATKTTATRAENTATASTADAKLEEVLYSMHQAKTAYSANTAQAGARPRERTTSRETQAPAPEAMSSQDVYKLQDARQSLVKQLFMVAGFFLFGFVVMAVITPHKHLLLNVFIGCALLYGIISAFVFVPDFRKISKDLKQRKKIKINVRIKDMTQEAGTTYFILQRNRYGIKKLTAPAKYYAMNLLNKELEIYVGKESNTMLEVVGTRY